MSDLNGIQRVRIEQALKMGLGYVLDFSNNSLRSFIAKSIELDIFDEKYNQNSSSKANRLRAFWDLESNYIVGKLIIDLLNYRKEKDTVNEVELSISDILLIDECTKTAITLKQGSIVEQLDAIQANSEDKDFVLLSRLIRESIESNQPEAALDRLHTFVVKYVRELCHRHGISFDTHEALHGIFGKYVKFIMKQGFVKSVMSERILKSAISVIDGFNEVRNSQSFAHDNPILNYGESILIFNNISNCIKFISSLEEQIASEKLEVQGDWKGF